VAAAETTSATFAWALHCCLSDRPVWDATVAEATGAVGAEARHLDRVVQETLRLHPATVVVPRVATTGFALAGHRIPPDTLLLFSPYHTHRLATLWPDALRFDPQRWNPALPGHRAPRRYEHLPFGGGPHRCVGAALATAMVTAALAQVARRADLRLLSRSAEPVGLVGMRPSHGLPLLVRDVAPKRGVG
jgi:cytochrome P450